MKQPNFYYLATSPVGTSVYVSLCQLGSMFLFSNQLGKVSGIMYGEAKPNLLAKSLPFSGYVCQLFCENLHYLKKQISFLQSQAYMLSVFDYKNVQYCNVVCNVFSHFHCSLCTAPLIALHVSYIWQLYTGMGPSHLLTHLHTHLHTYLHRHGILHKPSASVKFWPKSFHKSSVIFEIFCITNYA